MLVPAGCIMLTVGSEERFDGVLDALVERKTRRVNKRTQTKRDLADLNATLNDLE